MWLRSSVWIEHLTTNQGVRGSNPFGVTKKKSSKSMRFRAFLLRKIVTLGFRRHLRCGNGKRKEGSGKREEGRGKREAERGKREEERGKRKEERGKREEARGKREAGSGKRETGRGVLGSV